MGKRILIVNVNWVGDVLFSTPFIRAVREANPDAHIASLIHPRCREMLESNPRIDEIIEYAEEGLHRTIAGKWRLIRQLNAKKFDSAYILHRSFTKSLITMLAGIRERIGYPTKNRGWVLTKIIEEPSEDMHKVEYFLNIARGTGIEPKSVSYEFYVREEDRKSVRELLTSAGVRAGDRAVVLCPAGNWPPKRWPPEKFARLADELAEKFGVKIVIAASGKDSGLAADIKSVMSVQAFDVSGKTSLKELAALLERADLVIANDTGPMHLSVAVGARTIALFGPTSPRLTGPYGKGIYKVISGKTSCDVPCYDVTCNDNDCISAITVEEVMKAAGELLI